MNYIALLFYPKSQLDHGVGSPDRFMFQVTKEEWNALRSQIVTLEDLKSQNVISNAVDKDTNERHLIIICEILRKRSEQARAREIRCLKGGRLKCYFLPLPVTFPMFGEQNRW